MCKMIRLTDSLFEEGCDYWELYIVIQWLYSIQKWKKQIAQCSNGTPIKVKKNLHC